MCKLYEKIEILTADFVTTTMDPILFPSLGFKILALFLDWQIPMI